jgi:SAM-dependent methyltransferase
VQEHQRRVEAAVGEQHWWFAARRSIVGQLLRQLCPPDGRQLVLDVGCGAGDTAAALADSYNLVGIDPSPLAIDIARSRFPHVDFRRGALADVMSDLRGQVTACLIMDVLEHVSDDRALLIGVIEVLKPGGVAILTVPANERMWSPHDVLLGHRRRYDTISLSRLWSELPVDVRLLSFLNHRLLPVIRLIRGWRRARAGRGGPWVSDLEIAAPAFNRILERIFSGEARRLTRALAGNGRPYPSGVSLVAVLQKIR